MKTFLKCTALAAVAAVALVSCKQEAYAPEQVGEVHITVKAVPQDFANEGTRTYIDNTNTILWGTGEYMKIAVEAGESTTFGTSSNTSADLFEGEPEALFEFSITPGEASAYTYMGLYPASAAVANNDNAANYKVKLPTIQNATASSYDPAAYIMVAMPETFVEIQNEWLASYRRATALNKVTLTGLNDDIIQVDFIAGEGVNMAGSAHINLTTGEDVDIYDGENAVSVKYATALPASADKVVWFTTWDTAIAEGETLTIVAKSATKSYTRELTARASGILFKEGYLNKLSVNMANADVEDINSLEGNYVILAKKDDNTYFAMKGEAVGTRIASVDYTGSLESYNGSDDLIWTITAVGNSYTIKNGGNYVGWSAGSGNAAALIAEADYDADKCLMSIDENTDGTYKIYVTSETGRVLARNNSNAYFAFYGNTQYKDIVLVPAVLDTRAEVSLSFEEPEVVLDLDNYVDFEGQYATAYSGGVEVDDLDITYSWDIPADDSDFGSIDEDGTICLGGVVDVTATVTATFAGNDTYKPATATYTIVIHDTTTPTEGYQLVNSADGLTTGLYIIAAKVDGTYYAMSNTFASKIDGTAVTVTNNVISTSDAANYSLTLTNTGDDKFTIVGSSTLGCGNSADFNTNPSGDAGKWTITLKSNTTSGTFRIANVGTTSRGVVYRTGNTNKFAPYATSNVNGTEYYDVELFKYIGEAPVVKTNPTTEVAPSSPISLSVGDTQQLDVDTDSDGYISYESSDENVATVSAQGLITAVAAGSATITVTTAATDDFYAGTTEITVIVSAGASTIADVIAGGPNTYEVPDVTVYAVKGNALILGDGTAKMYAYKSNHGLSVGDVRTVKGTTKVYNEVYEFDGPTFSGTGTTTVDHGTAVEIDLVASTLQSSFTAAGNKYTAVYAHVIGTQSGRTITTDGGTALYLSANENATDGKTVEAYGYVYAYSTSHSNFNFIVTSIAEYVDPNAPALTVDPTSANWGSGENDTKTFTVTATNGTWSIALSDGLADWATVSTTATTITVTPKVAQAAAANTGSIAVTLTPTGTGYSIKTATISLSQAKYSAGGDTPDPETIVFADLNLSNGVQYTDPFNGGHFTITFAGGGNDGKYYDTGAGIRTYGGGTITIASTSNKIAEIEFTWSGDSYAPTGDVASPTGYSTSTKKWTGSANSVVLTRPSGSGHWRLQKVKVTYE